VLGERLAGLEDGLPEPNNLGFITPGDSGCRLRIETGPKRDAGSCVLFFPQSSPGGSASTMSGGPVEQTLGQGAQIQACPAHKNRQLAAAADILEHRTGFALVVAGREDLCRFSGRQSCDGNALLLLGRGLGGAKFR